LCLPWTTFSASVWLKFGTASTTHFNSVAVDPLHPNVIYTSLRQPGLGMRKQYIFRSTDFGQTWKNISYNLGDYSGKLVIVNFWATWCKPCKEEIPSLDSLSQNKDIKNLIVFPVNIENINYEKTKKFFSNLNVKKLGIFFDPNLNFVKELKLRGVPTTVIINKTGKEFARIIGSIDFNNKKFLKWLSNYD